MSASDRQALGTIAFQLSATLERYQADMVQLVQGDFDPDCYRRVSGQIDRMRMYAAALPPVSVAWVEVMIRHFELTQGLWMAHRRGRSPEELRALHAELEQAIQRLARTCAQLMASA